jgi:hypothetical protein
VFRARHLSRLASDDAASTVAGVVRSAYALACPSRARPKPVALELLRRWHPPIPRPSKLELDAQAIRTCFCVMVGLVLHRVCVSGTRVARAALHLLPSACSSRAPTVSSLLFATTTTMSSTGPTGMTHTSAGGVSSGAGVGQQIRCVLPAPPRAPALNERVVPTGAR